MNGIERAVKMAISEMLKPFTPKQFKCNVKQFTQSGGGLTLTKRGQTQTYGIVKLL